MWDKLVSYYQQLLFTPEPLATTWDIMKAFFAVILLGILVTGVIAFIVSRVIRRTHREEIAALMRSRFAWGWAFATCAIVQFADVIYLWHRDALASFAAAFPLLLNIVALSCIGLGFYFQVRFDLRRSQQIIKRTNEAR
jgi:cytochrome c oxidase assembly factor CtaG